MGKMVSVSDINRLVQTSTLDVYQANSLIYNIVVQRTLLDKVQGSGDAYTVPWFRP